MRSGVWVMITSRTVHGAKSTAPETVPSPVELLRRTSDGQHGLRVARARLPADGGHEPLELTRRGQPIGPRGGRRQGTGAEFSQKFGGGLEGSHGIGHSCL